MDVRLEGRCVSMSIVWGFLYALFRNFNIGSLTPRRTHTEFLVVCFSQFYVRVHISYSLLFITHCNSRLVVFPTNHRLDLRSSSWDVFLDDLVVPSRPRRSWKRRNRTYWTTDLRFQVGHKFSSSSPRSTFRVALPPFVVVKLVAANVSTQFPQEQFWGFVEGRGWIGLAVKWETN